MSEQQKPDPVMTMMQMFAGLWVSRGVYAAAKLGLADLLDTPKSSDELAKATGTHGPSLYRLLRALASVGVFRELPGKKFEQTDVSATLKTGPGSLKYLAISEMGPTHYGPWGELLHSIETGKPAFDKVFGEPVFEYFGKHPERAQIFNQSMTEITAMVEPAVLEAYDFSNCGTIVDVGGGHGGLLSAILKKHPDLKGIVFDAPNVVAGAPELLKKQGVADRCTTAGGDFCQSVPAGGDTYVMKHIIHDWDDAKCETILKNCHKVMKPGAKVLIIDQVLPGANEPSLGKWSDLLMMIMPGGMERTADEFKGLLERTGFTFSRIVQTKSPMGVVEGIKR